MTDRYRPPYTPSAPGRSATFNPARSSLPSSIGYSSLYAGDMHVMPSASRHPTTTPRGYTTSTTPAGVPTTTRTYAVTQDPRARPAAHDIGRARRSTLDSTSRPTPVIITTTQKDRPHVASSSHSSNARSGSPVRDDYRSSDGQFYTQPASTIRSRSTTRPHVNVNNDDYSRSRDPPRADSMLTPHEPNAYQSDAYRTARPSVVYPSDPRHSNAAADFGDEGYQYTNAGELARYDLEHTQPHRTRGRDSFDRGYYRPNINYNTDQRSLNIDTSPDLSRNYNSNTSRPYEGNNRGGPPPSTRGFDKLGRAYDGPRDVPPVVPAPPVPTSAVQSDSARGGPDQWEGRRSRPVSLYQDSMPRSAHHDEYYRSREEERNMRELRDRDRESERAHDSPHFQDEAIGTRGFGIRTDLIDDGRRDRRRELRREEPRRRSDEDMARPSEPEREERRRESRREEPKKRSDEDVARPSEPDRDDRRWSRQDPKDERRERRESKRGSDDEKERTRLRDKVASGLGIVGGAVGLGSAVKDDDKRDKDDRESRRRRSPDGSRERRRDPEDLERPRPRDMGKERDVDRVRDDDRDDVELRERNRRDAEAKLSGEAVASASDEDEAKRASRRNKPSKAGFNPNDTNDLMQLKEQLAAANVSDKSKGRDGKGPDVVESERTRSSSPTKDSRAVERFREESRGREPSVGPARSRQVRVVSPPRDKDVTKQVKGILKQPKASFPEDRNPIREGVAPHKEDKKSKETPPGARWTKVNRKLVNPEALTIGKERFETRDDFVIVLRVLSKEEIQAYAAATQVLRDRRRNKETGEDGERGRDHDRHRERDRDEDRDYDRDGDEEASRRHHRHHRHRDDDEGEPAERGDRERRRRHRKDDEDDYESWPKDSDPHGGHRPFREREREREREGAPA